MAKRPAMRTPIERCEEMSLHTQGVLARFGQVSELQGLAGILDLATSNMLHRQADLDTRRKALIALRIEVSMCDRDSDQLVRACVKRAEIEDGQPNGRLATRLYPDGSTPIIKPVGTLQVTEMRKLEGRYAEIVEQWPAAAADHAKLVASREKYEAALLSRKAGLDAVGQALVARDVAKEEFLDVYVEIASRIEGAFPRDRRTQDLFFLKDRERESDDEESP